MPIIMHSATVPMFVRMLGNLDAWLARAEAHAPAKKFDSKVYLAALQQRGGAARAAGHPGLPRLPAGPSVSGR